MTQLMHRTSSLHLLGPQFGMNARQNTCDIDCKKGDSLIPRGWAHSHIHQSRHLPRTTYSGSIYIVTGPPIWGDGTLLAHQKHCVTLAVRRLLGCHTAECVKEVVEKVMEWEIPESKVGVIVMDNRSNMVPAILMSKK